MPSSPPPSSDGPSHRFLAVAVGRCREPGCCGGRVVAMLAFARPGGDPVEVHISLRGLSRLVTRAVERMASLGGWHWILVSGLLEAADEAGRAARAEVSRKVNRLLFRRAAKRSEN